jgi:hypothetical protein
MTDEKKKDLVVFLDTIGRTIIAERTGESSDELKIKNPAVVNIVPQPVIDQNNQPVIDQITGQPAQRMALQLFPLFFREFLADKEEPVKFNFKKHNITMSDGDIALDYKVCIQYDQLFVAVGEVVASPQPQAAPAPAPAPAPQAAPVAQPKVQLFD